MPRTKRKFTSAFKADVAIEAVKGLKTTSELAQQYELHPVQVTQWKKEFLERAPELFDGEKKNIDEADRINLERDRLYQQIGQMSVEIEWLKKKLK